MQDAMTVQHVKNTKLIFVALGSVFCSVPLSRGRWLGVPVIALAILLEVGNVCNYVGMYVSM